MDIGGIMAALGAEGVLAVGAERGGLRRETPRRDNLDMRGLTSIIPGPLHKIPSK